LSEQNIVFKLVNRNKIKTNDSRIYMLTPILNSEYNYFNIFNKSAPLIILHGNTKIFFPGGIEKRGEEVLIDSYGDFLKSDLMQIANFGSDVSTSEKFYKLVSPNFSVISVGLGNYMEYPDEDVVRIIESNESQLLRTDEDGAVLFISDGQNIDLVNWRLN
jgi:competence protein ComEC